MKYLAITAILCLILAGVSFAGNVTMTEVVTGGNLTLGVPADFSLPGVTLGGAATKTTVEYRNTYVEDSRGTGAGWNLGVQISQFVTAGTPQRSIDASLLFIAATQINMQSFYGQGIDGTNGPKSLINSLTNIQSSEVKAVQTSAGYGMGKYGVYLTHSLDIPASAYAGTYTATLTATLNAVP